MQIPPVAAPADEVVYLVSTCGYPNYGDEFTTAAWLKFLARTRPDAEVWLDCQNPGQESHLFSELHPRLRITDTLWRVVWETADMDLDTADAHVDARIVDLGTPRYDLGLLGARRASTVHLLGGAHVNSQWPHHEQLLRAAVRLREQSGARLFATGLCLAPPLEGSRLRNLLDGFDHVSVRDSVSAEVSGAEQGVADAFLGLAEVPGFWDSTKDDDGTVWVCLQSDLVDEATLDAAVAAVRTALTGPYAGRPVGYLEAMPWIDRVAYDRLSDLIPEENFLPFARLWHEGFPGRAGQTWLTTRFHLHLLAASCGAQGTALAIDEDYYGVKHQSLLDVGSGWSITPQGATTITKPSVWGTFRSDAGRHHRTKQQEADQLYPALAPPPVLEPAPEPPRPGWRRRR